MIMGVDDDDFVLSTNDDDPEFVGVVVVIAVVVVVAVIFSLPTFIAPNSFSTPRSILRAASMTFPSNISRRLRSRIRRSVSALANAASRRTLLDVSRAAREARLLANAFC
jgi:hypothetical protein